MSLYITWVNPPLIYSTTLLNLCHVKIFLLFLDIPSGMGEKLWPQPIWMEPNQRKPITREWSVQFLDQSPDWLTRLKDNEMIDIFALLCKPQKCVAFILLMLIPVMVSGIKRVGVIIRGTTTGPNHVRKSGISKSCVPCSTYHIVVNGPVVELSQKSSFRSALAALPCPALTCPALPCPALPRLNLGYRKFCGILLRKSFT